MAPGDPIYKVDERSRGKRLSKRTKYEQEMIQNIIRETPILHVSFTAPLMSGDPFPTILPMLGTIGQYEGDEEPHVYLHGSSIARLFRITKGKEIALCVAGTILDGYVLALAPFHNSCNYRSAILFGYGQVVEDEAEVLYGLQLITNNTIPKQWENSRNPPTQTELKGTGLLKMRIETASVKTRTGGAEDDRADKNNPEVIDKIWTGMVPTHLTLGDPVPNEQNRVKEVPEYLVDWVADRNSINEQKAADALEEM